MTFASLSSLLALWVRLVANIIDITEDKSFTTLGSRQAVKANEHLLTNLFTGRGLRVSLDWGGISARVKDTMEQYALKN